MSVKPVGDQIIVLPMYQERADHAGTELGGMDLRLSEGGVVLPDSIENEPIEGRVVALGDGYVEGRCPKCEPDGRQYQFTVKVDDVVIFPLWKATSIILDDVEHCIITERDLCGIQP